MSDFRTIWLRKYLGSKKKYRVFDIGSYDASDAIRIKKRYPDAIVYSFEASKRNYEKVRTNADRYAVKHYNLALSDKTSTVRFYDSEGSSQCSGSILLPSNCGTKDGIVFSEPHDINAQSINDFCSEKHIEEIDLAHIDVQGAEAKVIIGASRVKIRMVFAEVSEHSVYEGCLTRIQFSELMTGKGYVLVKELNFDNLYVLKQEYTLYKARRLRAVYYEIIEYLEAVLNKLHLMILITYNKLYVKRIRKILFGY